MLFTPTQVHAAFVIDLERRTDERGFFARTWCQREFAAHGLTANVVQINVSQNKKRGTLRGMHYQLAPFEEAKTVSCTKGAIYDVVLDLRRGSPTYLRWDAFELTAENRRMLHIPEGCAHGFQTLTDDTELLYFMSEFYAPEQHRGVRYDDPAFGITWPLPAEALTVADQSWPDYTQPGRHAIRPIDR
ncbi:MAG: dTDP-4-dehydrorhamnose 3,5-epimerase [Planctomycetes bacterium]|nr:dTDP-4-dehydrorhamnose 3,5-epimerase [Planctomycetota bacterium]